MECNEGLNSVVVFSFFFVSVALGIKWISETLVEYALAKQGLQMTKMNAEQMKKFLEGEDEE